MKNLDHVVLSALLHDIGKFFERGELLSEYRHDEDQKQIDCPIAKEGYRSHLHILHTRRFCEKLAEHLTVLQPQEYQRTKTADQHWINLAARHHVAAGAPLEILVQHADHLASSEREAGNYYESRIHQKTFLESILERVSLHDELKQTLYRLPLTDGSTDDSCLFPQTTDQLGMQKNKKGIWLSQTLLKDKYAGLGKALLHDISGIPQPHTASDASLRSTVTTLLALFERFLSQVPAATNINHPDISLFDHLRITAAIAEGLYRHHEARGELDTTDAIKREDRAKWRLVCGDFSGIQSFIYRITSKGAAKALRGRSLYIQLLCDAVSEHLIQQLGLYPTARIYSSGGKFYLLIADCLEKPLSEAVDNVNGWLLKQFGGDVFLGIGIAKVSGTDFAGGGMSAKWKEANDDLMKNRNQRFAAQMDADFFASQSAMEEGKHCHVCGRSDPDAGLKYEEKNNRQSCHQCRMLERLGQGLADAHYFFWVGGEDRKLVADVLHHEKCFSFDAPLDVDLYLLEHPPVFTEGLALHHSRLERLNNVDCMDENWHGYACSYRWLAKWDRDKQSAEWDFEKFASEAKGIKRIGVLRMDVDNLGQMFIRGFRWAEDKQMGSLSRVATLSRQLNLFFSGYLMQLLKHEPRVQVIYAGGDDLFLVGSWDALPDVARNIEQSFTRFAAQNPDFSISGGITMVRGKYPISRAAEMAGDAESSAKALTREVAGKNVEKSAFCMMDAVIGWEDYPAAEKLRDLIGKASESNHAIINRMRQVVHAQQEFALLQRQSGMDEETIIELAQWQKWRWQLVYSLHRLAGRNSEMKATIEAIRRAVLANEIDGRMSETAVMEWLQLPTRWTEYLQREAK